MAIEGQLITTTVSAITSGRNPYATGAYPDYVFSAHERIYAYTPPLLRTHA